MQNFEKFGSEYIGGLILAGIKNGSRRATVTGCWEIAHAVRLPSDFTLVLKNCHLKMKNGVYDNMFINEHHGTYIGRTLSGTDRNISIIGEGSAILDGGEYNGLHERNSNDIGIPMTKNNLLLFTNVDGITVKKLAMRNQRWWAMNFVYCRGGHISDIDFCSNDEWVDGNGTRHSGLLRDKYDEVYIKNSDGIDLRQGCSDFLIENLTGFIEDDAVALTNLNGFTEKSFFVDGLPSDISGVIIRNLHLAAYCSIVRLLNQGDLKLHDISIEDIYDTSAECEHLDKGGYAVRVGDAKHMYGKRHSTADETYNISIKNVYGCGGRSVLHLAGAIGNLTIEDVRAGEGTALLEDFRS